MYRMLAITEFTNKKIFLALFLFILVFFDFAVKQLIRSFGGFFVCNAGISWGLYPNLSIFWPIIALFLIFVYFYFCNKEIYKIPLLLIISGGIANLLDRFFLGCVIDYIKIPVFHFPLFNLADVWITCGFILLCFSLSKK